MENVFDLLNSFHFKNICQNQEEKNINNRKSNLHNIDSDLLIGIGDKRGFKSIIPELMV